MPRRKWIPLILFICVFITIQPLAVSAEEAELNLAPNAKSAILMDAHSGTIIYEKNSNEPYPPASITKIMTMLLVMDEIQSGKMTLDDVVITSERAASMGGSQIFLETGEKMTVRDLMKGVAMASGNDASVALAEKIAGTEEAFVGMMNEKAKQLGMTETRFYNSSGLPAEGHVSTASDIAKMSQALLKHEQITKFTGEYQDYLRQDTSKPFWLVNTNKLVRFYDGVDGLKTGYTSEAKYGLAATAIRDQLRLIAVVLGEPDVKTRNAEVTSMLNYGYSQFATHSIFEPGDLIGELHVERGKVTKFPLLAEQSYRVLMKRGFDPEAVRHEVVFHEPIVAPIMKGDLIGTVTIYNGESQIEQFELYVPETIKKANLWSLLKRTAVKMISAS